MSHKRVSQLVELTAAEVAGDDLFYIIDVSAKEGKKTTAAQLGAYLNASGSFTVVQADTASYVLGTDVHGTVTSSLTSVSASWADASLSASWADASLSSSWAETASYAVNATSDTAISSSWASHSFSAVSASWASSSVNANAAASLIYPNVSTASYAIRALLVTSASYATTASYINSTFATVTSASHAARADYADMAGVSALANELNFPNTSTASYAMVAENFSLNQFIDYGIFLATSQSISSSQLDLVQVLDSSTGSKQTNIEVIGTVTVPYTSSVLLDESLNLVLKNRGSGIETTLDSAPVYIDISRTVNNWDDLMTGSVKIPFNLAGSSSLYGNYMIFVTGSSSKIQIEPNRISRFNISSLSDGLDVFTAEPIMFQVSPEGLILITFYTGSGHLGPFTDYRDGMLTTGSATINDVSVRNTSATSVRYVWTLPNLKIFDCGQNTAITDLTTMPDTLVSMSCDSCSIGSISSLANAVSLSYFNCAQNSLAELPTLPISLSYLNCARNFITELPTLPETMSYLNCVSNSIDDVPLVLPYGLTHLYMDKNDFTSLTTTFPETLVTISFSNNPLPVITSILPDSAGWLDFKYSALFAFPEVPVSMSYLNVESCSLTQAVMDEICSSSVSYGRTNGYIDFRGNGPIMVSTVNDYILTLQTSGWVVDYDYAV